MLWSCLRSWRDVDVALEEEGGIRRRRNTNTQKEEDEDEEDNEEEEEEEERKGRSATSVCFDPLPVERPMSVFVFNPVFDLKQF